MKRARVLGTVLAVILLACALVVYLDQRGGFSGAVPGGGGAVSDPASPPGDSGYGDLK